MVGIDARAKVAGQHLGTEADAQIGRSLAQDRADPLCFEPDKIIRIVGAHRAAKNDRSGVVRHGGRQRIAIARAADVERITALDQEAPDAPGRGMLLMQDHQDRLPAGASPGTNKPHDQNPEGIWQPTEVSGIEGRRTMAGREIARG